VQPWFCRQLEQALRRTTDRGALQPSCGLVPTVLTPKLEARVLEATRRTPTDGATHWSMRKLGAHLHVSHTSSGCI
jgi:hypothetical protein